MRRVVFIITLLLLAITAIEAQNSLAVTGVSRELALHRRATITDMKYDLHFEIPSDNTAPIEATNKLTFKLDEQDEVVLDFRESTEKIKSVIINKKKVEVEVVYEHITLPKRYLKKGENTVIIEFTAGNQSLNRQKEYMYTLFVPDRARTVFPCMDQPDMKAVFHLTLGLPAEWIAVANSQVKKRPRAKNGRYTVEFHDTEPLPTYLFAFAAGKFHEKPFIDDNKRIITAYYRETDEKRISQLPEIARQIFYSLNWQEKFTDTKYPFKKYDFVILPGFQFGGMEHTGCTFYNDNTLFLPENPTADEELARAQLIAHETSHMWFGDYVTMRWFNDVWTKEVFANYFAAAITRDEFPSGNHDLLWLKNYTAASLAEDRTEGRTSIRQDLDNLNNAGLIYNNIIYNKAPIMMRKMVELMGEEAFKRGIRRYVHDFAYGNASWEDLVEILDAETPVDLKAFSEVWVNQKGMPTINLSLREEGDLADCRVEAVEVDSLGRGLVWPQTYENRLFKYQILPNYDGRGYGFFTMDDEQLHGLLLRWHHETDATAKQSMLITLYENYLAKKISDDEWVDFLLEALSADQDKLTVSTILSYLQIPMWNLSQQKKDEVEENLLWLAETHKEKTGRIQILRLLIQTATSTPVVEELYDMWAHRGSDILSINDYMTFAYELAIRYPEIADDIIAEQRSRLRNPDRQRQFDYIARAVSPNQEARDTLFAWLLVPENRRIEPWAGSALYYLNHPLREYESVQYIQPALQELKNVQRTGDIFFPSRWCNSLLSGHHSLDAYVELLSFFTLYPDYPELLKNKIQVAAYNLYREYGKPLP